MESQEAVVSKLPDAKNRAKLREDLRLFAQSIVDDPTCFPASDVANAYEIIRENPIPTK